MGIRWLVLLGDVALLRSTDVEWVLEGGLCPITPDWAEQDPLGAMSLLTVLYVDDASIGNDEGFELVNVGRDASVGGYCSRMSRRCSSDRTPAKSRSVSWRQSWTVASGVAWSQAVKKAYSASLRVTIW